MSTNDNVKMSQIIVKDIMTKIQSGEYPLHSRIPPEMKLAEMYNVGRSTVRESLSVLKSLKIVSSRQGGGHYIEEDNLTFLMNSMDIETEEYQDIKHLFEVRFTLETKAAYLAAERRTAEDIENLKAVLRKFKRALDSEEETGQVEDYEFHKTMIQATHNPIMVSLMTDLSEMYHRALEITLKQNLGLIQKRQELYTEHEAIFNAIEQGQPELAKVQCTIHLEKVQKKLNFMYNVKGSVD